MGDSTTAATTNQRPRKSTMSKLGRVFGLSSTNLVHDGQQAQAQAQQQSEYRSPESNTSGTPPNIPRSNSSLSSLNCKTGKTTPLTRSRPESPISSVTTEQDHQQAHHTNGSQQHHQQNHIYQPVAAQPITALSRQSSLRVPPNAAATALVDQKKHAANSNDQFSPVDHPSAPASVSVSSSQSLASPSLQPAAAGAGAPAASVHGPASTPLSRASSTTSKQASSSSSSAAATPMHRFVMLENGQHEHHLKNAKRQEKLGHMIKDLLGAKKLRSEAVSAVPNILSSVIPPISEMSTSAEESSGAQTPTSQAAPPPLQQQLSQQQHQQQQQSTAPPTLLTGLINQVKRGEITQYSGGPTGPSAQPLSATSTIKVDSRSFVEKYGRCQEVVGRGAFGVVRISHKKDKTSEILYAVKEFKRRPQESDKKYSRRLTSEFCISSSLQHSNIIHTLDLLQDAKGDYCEVMEFCAGGDLYSLIITAGKLEYIEADCFFKQLMRGVSYMHEMGVAHRDLKPENLLLTANGTLKITDFGNSELFRTAWETDIHLSGGICGSSPYIAPEEYTASEFDPRKVDIWSCGVIYMAMRTGRQLWKLANAEDEFYSTYLSKRKDAKGYEPIEQLKRARCRNVIYSILDPVPSRRITSKQILNSEWCREIKLCAAGDGKVY